MISFLLLKLRTPLVIFLVTILNLLIFFNFSYAIEEWNFNGSTTEGWVGDDTYIYAADNVLYSNTLADARDPRITSPTLNINAGSYSVIEMRMASLCSNRQGYIYFRKNDNWSDFYKVYFNVTYDWDEYKIKMLDNSNWSGDITAIRIDYASTNEGQPECLVALDWIRIIPENGSISGGVRDYYTASPLSNVAVRLEQDGTPVSGLLDYTNSVGVYEITDVPPGEYRLSALNKPGYQNSYIDGKDILSGKALTGQNLTMKPNTPVLDNYQINNGDSITYRRTVTLNNSAQYENVEDYMASENSTFSGASWQDYDTDPSFSLSAGFGSKRVYLKLRNGTGESTAQSDTINYYPTPQISDNKSSMIVGGKIELYCDLGGSDGASRNVTFFISPEDGDLTTVGVQTNSVGQATKELTATTDWVPSADFACRDDLSGEASGYDAGVTVESIALPAPTPLKPLTGETLVSLPNGEVGLRWEAVNEASGYRLIIDSSIEINIPSGQTVYNPAGLDPDYDHNWKVCTLDISSECVAESNLETFSINDSDPGFVARTENDPDVYWIKFGLRRKIVDQPTFFGLGYSDAEIQWFEDGSLNALPTGTDVLEDNQRFCYRAYDDSTVYVIENGESHPFFQEENFHSQGFTDEEIFWAKPEGVLWIQQTYGVVEAPMIRIEPKELDF